MLKNFQELSLELARVVSKLWGSAVIQGTGHFCVCLCLLFFERGSQACLELTV